MTTRKQASLSALLTVAAIGPLALLQIRHFGVYPFPHELFTALTLSFFSVVYAAGSLLRKDTGTVKKLVFLGLLVLGSLMFSTILEDQMPCFRGIPNCD